MSDEFELSLDHLPLKKPSQVSEPELIFLVGAPGGGKTHYAASASEVEGQYPVLVIDTEGSAAGTLSNFDDDRIDILQVDNYSQLESLLEALTTKTHKYKTVIIDTFDVAQEWAVEEFQEDNPQDGFKAWREVKDWTVQVARDLKAADFLGIMVFHDKTEVTDTGKKVSKLSLQGSAKDVLPGVPDMIGWVERKADKQGEETTTIYYAPDPNRPTKNRFGLPYKVEHPSLSQVYELIRDRQKAKSKAKKETAKESK